MKNRKDQDVAKLWQQLKHSPTQSELWLNLAGNYTKLGLPWQAGYAARQTTRLDATLLTELQAIGCVHFQDESQGDALLGRAEMPQSDAMVERFSLQVQDCPGDWLTWLYLARLCKVLAQSQEAIEHAVSLEPIVGESLHWLGVWRLNAGDAQAAVSALSALLEVRPVRFGSMMYLGEALLRTGKVAAAEKAFARASQSNNPDFLLTLSSKVFAHNYWQEAMQVLQKAISLRPKSVPLLLALAKIQSETYELKACRDSLAKISELEPQNQEAYLLTAGLQGRMGDARGHLATLQKAYESGGDPLSRLASSVAMTSLYNDTMTANEVAALHRELCAPIEAAVTQKIDFGNRNTPGQRLRIACVTGDLHRQHPVNIFMLPVLKRIDHALFEVFVYHTGKMHDEYTRQAKSCTDHWLEAVALDDAALQQAIVADEIDILIDLGGHTASHRLGVFALRAAPVQVTFLGYPHSTGLSCIDWLVGDATVTPAEHLHLFSEGIAQLPQSVFCWAPVDSYPLPTAPVKKGPVVFGSFNNAMKITPKTVALWARVLKAVPDSTLLLKAPSFRDLEVQTRFTALFVSQGVEANRLEFRGPTELAAMMQEYADLDIALDPTPYNGGTTTLQALWMGVPVVTLLGTNFVSRMGASFMRTLNRSEWIAHDETAYVQIAAQLAAGIATLRGSRALFREQMAQSALCDISLYVRDFQDLLHKMWQAYEQGGTRLIEAQNNE